MVYWESYETVEWDQNCHIDAIKGDFFNQTCCSSWIGVFHIEEKEHNELKRQTKRKKKINKDVDQKF